MNRTILQGDVLKRLADIPDESIDCIISSPPYWGLRDYGIDGQLGLEPDFRDYLKILSHIMDELKRVLKKTGSCWINLGDTYCGHKGEMKNPGYTNEEDRINYRKNSQGTKQNFNINGVSIKSKFGIPERFYINCIDNGWIARNHIPWFKANSLPSSAKDRFTNKWESIFFFTKNQKYYFNLDAVREKTTTESKPFKHKVRESKKGLQQQKLLDEMYDDKDKNSNKYGTIQNESKHRQGMNKDRGNNLIEKRNLPTQKEFVDKLRNNFNVDDLVKLGLKKSTVEHWFRYDDSGFSYPSVQEWSKVNSNLFPELLDVWYVTDSINSDEKQIINKQDSTLGVDGKPNPIYKGFNERWNNKTSFTLQDVSKLTTQPVSELTPSEICELIGYDPDESCEHCSRSFKRHVTTDRGGSSHENYPVCTM